MSNRDDCILNSYELSASIICLNQLRLEEIIAELQTLGICRIHIDFIDNAFSGLGLPKEILLDIQNRFSLPLDIHFMVADPEPLVEYSISQGVDCVAVHQDALTLSLMKRLRKASQSGTEVSLVLNPGEIPCKEAIYHTGATRITAMSVKPGAAGRPFEPDVFETIRHATYLRERKIIQRIEVDGAIGPDTFPLLVRAGADIGVIGSTVLPNRNTVNNKLQNLFSGLNEIDHPLKQAIA